MSAFGSNNEGKRFYDNSTPQMYNVNTTHPLIGNSQDYMFYKKYVSIHSEDRDLIKYPNSCDFEIELPQDYLNVASLKLVQWTFPANYSTFSTVNSNITLSFKILNPYNPSDNLVPDIYSYRIFEALFINKDNVYQFNIEEGFYNPEQMATELTNKFNYTVSSLIQNYFIQQGWTDTLNEFELKGGYNRFIVVYNNVSLKLWFGNKADQFELLNDTVIVNNTVDENVCLLGSRQLPNSSNWGLPSYLGLTRCNYISINGSTIENNSNNISLLNGIVVPRFYYGDVTPGDNGYWLLPNMDLSGSQVNWVEATYKINLMGEAFMYLEIAGQNCIDETKPYNVSKFTLTTNQTNGVADSAFAKLPIPTTPLAQWFDRDALPYKYYYPPAERMRRLKFRIRYHNDQIVNFGLFNYSFMLEFTLMTPMMLRDSKSIVYPPSVCR